MDARTCSRGSRLARLVLAVALAVPAAASGAPTDPLTLPAAKAGFLYKFAKFAEWPADVLSTTSPLVLCVVGDDAVADELRKAVDGHNIGGHQVVIARGKADTLPLCHMLYMSGMDGKQSARLLGSLKGMAVFTVSDGQRFADMGGVAQLILENDRMHFAINMSAAERAQISLSSKLLGLATIVKD